MGVLCAEFIYGSVDNIVGWNKNEMIVLICTSLIVNQLFRGFINPNQTRFADSISSGAFDKMILKPVNIIFQINSGSIDISSLTSILAPLIIVFIQITALGTKLGILKITLYILLIINGVVILSSFMMLLYSLAFMFVKVDGIDNIYYMMMSISEKPKEIFSQKSLFYGFLFIVPAIPLANAPASVFLEKSSPINILYSIGAGVLFLVISILAIRIGMKKYTSASS